MAMILPNGVLVCRRVLLMWVQLKSPGLHPVVGHPYSPKAENLCFKNLASQNYAPLPLEASSPSSLNSFKTAISFGCRQLAFMTEGDAPSKSQQSILRDVLVNSGNSLKAQSKKRLDP
ncbi:MAG: hypothetical protein K2X66_16265, partial [Cyanobacteria bacterium]|nr:hypothetical protein [Cyanobacteriota bacterium]